MKKLKYIMTLLIITIIASLYALLPSDNLSLFNNEAYLLDGDFQVYLPEGSVENTSLPAKYDVAVNEEVRLKKKLDKDFPNMMTLRIRSSMQYIKVYVNDELIFENNPIEYGILRSAEASAWYLVDLPHDSGGKTLEISISSPVKAFSGTINQIYYGKSGDLKLQLLSNHSKMIFISSMLLFIGFMILVVYTLLNKNTDERLFYLSFFIITTSIWLLSEMDLFQFITGNRFIVGGISYMMLPLMCVSLLQYLRIVVLYRYKKMINGLSSSYLILFALNISLQVSGRAFFIDSFIYLILLTLFSIILVVGLLIFDIVHFKDSISKKYIKYLSFFLIAATIEIFMFFTGYYNSISSLTSIGFISFFSLLIIDSMNYLNRVIEIEHENKIFKNLAYTDILTKGMNRAAFERDIEKLTKTDDNGSFRLVLADLNNLKLINDNYGHSEGDYAIKTCYLALTKTGKDKIQCYRLGGDEFVCIIKDTDEKYYKEYMKEVEKTIDKSNMDKPYKTQLAVGTGIYAENAKESFDAFMHRVDYKMYDNKRLKKKDISVL